MITNLADALPLVDRMKDAMSGELTRRQEVLRRAGNFASLRDYDRARASGADLPPLPSLLLVCDEFTEMLTAKPDFIDLFVQIGRIGRSIGVHLLLATQRLEEGRLRGLETNLSYRIALRTFSAHESRMTLDGATDAAELPSTPGHGFLAVGTEPLQRFKAAYVSGPYRRSSRHRRHPGRCSGCYDYTTAHVPAPADRTPRPAPVDPQAPSLMEVIVDRLAGKGMPAHQVWLPPLAEPPNLDDLLGGLVTDPARGVTTANPSLRGALTVPIALVDKPFEQRRDIAWFDLSGAAGHVAIVGNPQSGKSTAVRTLVTALALTHTPQEVQVYCLDFGGGSLGALRDLPHVGGVAGRLETAPVRRTVGEVATLLADRERRFAARRHRLGGDVPPAAPTVRSGRHARGAGGRVRRRVPRRRRLGHAAQRVRGPRAGPGRRRHPWAELRRPPRRHRHPMGRLPPQHPGPVRFPTRAAPRRPGRLSDQPQDSRRTCRPARRVVGSTRMGCTCSPRSPR